MTDWGEEAMFQTISRQANEIDHLRDLLLEARRSIDDELSAAGEDEVRQHPVLRRHKKVADRIDAFLGNRRR